MMKKHKYIIFSIFLYMILLCDIKSVSAADLIAKCVYEKNGEQIIININKKMEVNIPTNYTQVSSMETFHKSVKIVYADFMKNKKFSCSNLSSIYVTTSTTSSSSRVDHYYIYSTKSEESGLSFPSVKQYTINKKKSKVYEENIENKKNQWDRTCHYGNYYLSFNKKKYESNIITSGRTMEDNVDIMQVILKNLYSCPNFMCIKNYSFHGYTIEYVKFSENELQGYSCTVSTQYGKNKYVCGAIETYIKKIKSLKNPTKINQEVSKYQAFCQSALKNSDYSNSNNCIKECLSTQAEVKKIATGENSDSDKINKCTKLSNKITWFIHNILKWMKYIAPVLVIILGILDFIKALASSDDDAMKKAQKRFIIRLVAASLLFLLPLIIDYILKIFNLVDSNCDVSDMFK